MKGNPNDRSFVNSFCVLCFRRVGGQCFLRTLWTTLLSTKV